MVRPSPEYSDRRMAPPRTDAAPPLLRNLLVPISLVLAFALYYWAHLRIGVVVLAVSPLVLLYVLAPWWAVASAKAFDRDALRLRAGGRSAELRARLDRALGMRLFAPPVARAERLAEILRETGQPAAARREYARAIAAAGGAPTLSMYVGLAHSAYAAGEHGEAIGAYRKLLELDASLPRVRLRLAHAHLRRDAKNDVADALEVLDAVPASAADRDEIALLRAYADARRGEPASARARLAEVAPGAHPELRAEIEAALASPPPALPSKKKGKRR